MTIDFKNLNISNLSPQNDFEEKVVAFINEWFLETDMVKVQTSGSTGAPKIFEIEKSKMRNSAKMTCDCLDLKEGDSALICLPIEYISGKMMVVRAIEKKLVLNIAEPSIHPLNQLKNRIDFCAMTPLQVENSLEKIHFIKNLIIGGAAVSESLKSKIHQALNGNSQTKIYETYGMSETLSHIALKEIFPISDEYFTVFNNVEVSADERGCLKISAPNLNPENLQTNDIVEFKNKNQFKFLGRIDNVINSGGAKIFPEELEKIIKSHIPNEVVFTGLTDKVFGQKLVLIIEGKENEKIIEQISNIKFEKSFHQPKYIIFVDEIPRTPNGKVDRRKTAELISSK